MPPGREGELSKREVILSATPTILSVDVSLPNAAELLKSETIDAQLKADLFLVLGLIVWCR